MTEQPVMFGPDGSLVGIATLPDRPVGADDVAFLLFNAGVIPRVGPHRLNVRLARPLAAQGHAVLRFDLSGQGDSRSATGGGDFVEQGARDIAAAMDHLQATLGVRRFAVVGVCSGAMQAYRVSLGDPRVVALMMFDGYWYRTRWTQWVRDWKRFRASRPAQAWAALRRRVTRSSVPEPKGDKAPSLFSGESNPAPQQFSAAMQQLADRGVAVAMLFSGSVIDYYSYGAQMRHYFAGAGWLAKVRCELHEDIDHTFLTQDSQRRMVELVEAWLPEVRRAASARP